MSKHLVRYICIFLAMLFIGCSSQSGDDDADKIRLTAIERLQQGKTYLFLEGLDDAIQYYTAKADTTHLLEMYQLASIQMKWKSQQDSAAMYLIDASNFATPTTSPSVSDICLDLSDLYSHPILNKDYAKAIEYAHKAIQSDKSGANKSRALHDIGIYYAFLSENDSAVAYLDKAIAHTPTNSPYYTTFALNYANLPVSDFNRSIKYLDNIDSESLGKLITKGFLYLNQNRIDSATLYLRQSNNLYNSNPEKYSINTYNSLRMLSNCIGYAKSGKVFPGKGTEINDSISERISLNKKIESETAEKNAALEVKLLESKSQTKNVWIVALTLMLVAGGLFAWIFWNSKKKYIHLQKEIELLRRKQIAIEADEERPDDEVPFEIIMKRADICISRFRATGTLNLIQKGELAYDDNKSYLPLKDRSVIRQSLLECFADFIIDMRIDSGKMTMDDIVTALLSVMRTPNSAIAACLGVSDSAVRTRKTRLKSRMSFRMAQFVFG